MELLSGERKPIQPGELRPELITDALYDQLVFDAQVVPPEEQSIEAGVIDAAVQSYAAQALDENVARVVLLWGEIYKWRLHGEYGSELPLGTGYSEFQSSQFSDARRAVYLPQLEQYGELLGEELEEAVGDMADSRGFRGILHHCQSMLLDALADPDSAMHQVTLAHPVFDFIRSFDEPKVGGERPLTPAERQSRLGVFCSNVCYQYGVQPGQPLPYQAARQIAQYEISLDDERVYDKTAQTAQGRASHNRQRSSGMEQFRTYSAEKMRAIALDEGLEVVTKNGTLYTEVPIEDNDRARKQGELDTATVAWEATHQSSLKPLYRNYDVRNRFIAELIETHGTNSPKYDNTAKHLVDWLITTVLYKSPNIDSTTQAVLELLASASRADFDPYELFGDNVRRFSLDNDAVILQAKGPVVSEPRPDDPNYVTNAFVYYARGRLATMETLAEDTRVLHTIQTSGNVLPDELIGRMIIEYGSYQSDSALAEQAPDVTINRHSSPLNFGAKTPLLIPGFKQIESWQDQTLLTEGEHDPYAYSGVELPIKHNLIAWLDSVEATELADALRNHESITVDELADTIALNSDYAISESEVARELVTYSMDKPVATVRKGRLQLQCQEAASLMVAILNDAYGHGSAVMMAGHVIGINPRGELGTNSIGHAQVLFTHNGRQVILDPTPPLNASQQAEMARYRKPERSDETFSTLRDMHNDTPSYADASMSGAKGWSPTHAPLDPPSPSAASFMPRARTKPRSLKTATSPLKAPSLADAKDWLDRSSSAPTSYFDPSNQPKPAAEVKSPEAVYEQLEAQLLAIMGLRSAKELYRQLPRPHRYTHKPLPQPDPVWRTLAAIRAAAKGKAVDSERAKLYIEKYPKIQPKLQQRGLRHYSPAVLNALSRAVSQLPGYSLTSDQVP